MLDEREYSRALGERLAELSVTCLHDLPHELGIQVMDNAISNAKRVLYRADPLRRQEQLLKKIRNQGWEIIK